ncbi:MAG: hypothetical protein IJT05_07215 [Lachnospiraceae bacterium]|nr:hypothetical protein [Lachnospiraceae bacterium]
MDSHKSNLPAAGLDKLLQEVFESSRKKVIAEDAKKGRRKTDRWTAADLTKEIRQDEALAKNFEIIRQRVLKKEQSAGSSEEDPENRIGPDTDYDYLIDKKWLYYYDKYNLMDAETREYVEKAMHEYSAELRSLERARREESQEEAAYFHDGAVTIQELKQYESRIHGRTRRGDKWMKAFRQKLVQQMMIDRSFAQVLTENTSEYALLEVRAAQQLRELEFTANVYGLEKVANCVGRKERERTREDLRRLHAASEAAWRQSVNDEGAAKVRWLDIIPADDIALSEGFPVAVNDDFSDAADEKLTSALGSLELATGDVFGLSEDASENAKNAFFGIVEAILSWGRSRTENEFVRRLMEDQYGPSELYLDKKVRDYVVQTQHRCSHLSDLLYRLKLCPVYSRLAADEQLPVREAEHWIAGYRKWFGAHLEQIRAWDSYFRLEEEGQKALPDDRLPKPMKRIPFYFIN